ncbi:MAG: hypothetical protein PHG85_00665 [Candidatus Altiarchaeota archaeon]|nr:hypothetical protein [Candidatus Altiarchaeota archaeon]
MTRRFSVRLLAAVGVLMLLSAAASAYEPDYMTFVWKANMSEVVSGFDAADINGDGALELLVSSSAEGMVYAFGTSGEILWKYGVPGYVNFVRGADLDGDGRSEVLTGSSSHLYVLNSSGGLLWKYYTESEAVENAVAVDVNGDGLKEVLFSTNADSCGGNNLYAIHPETADKVWTYHAGYYYPNVFKVINSSRGPLIVLGTVMAPVSGAGCIPVEQKNAEVIALNLDGSVAWIFNTTAGVLDMQAGDLDGGGGDELALAMIPLVVIIDNNGRLRWLEDMGDDVDSVAFARMKDGTSSVLAGTYKAFLFDSTGNEKNMLGTTDRAYSVAAAALNADGDSELIIGSERVYVYDSSRSLLWNSTRFGYVGRIITGNFDSTPDIEVAVSAGKQVMLLKPGIRAKLQEADAYYSRARQYYSSGQYTLALDYAGRAKEIYYRFEKDDDARRVLSLIAIIDAKVNSTYVLSREADVFYSQALDAYTTGDFINASLAAQTARAKYEFIRNDAGQNASDFILIKSRLLMDMNASISSELAFKAYADGDYDAAIEYANTAKTFYIVLHNSTQANTMDELAKAAEYAKPQPITDKIYGILDNPTIRKLLSPSENKAVNTGIRLVYVLLLGFLLTLLISIAGRLISYIRIALKKEKLDLNAIKPADGGMPDAAEAIHAAHAKQASFTLVFMLVMLLLVFLTIAYIALR